MIVEELAPYGLEEMDDDAIEEFLRSQSVGVLGLPTGGVPYVIPLSYAYDGESVYFTYLLGESSRKGTLTAQEQRGRFLVYDVETPFRWKSVMLTGDLREIPESEWPELESHPRNSWRPSVLQSASTSAGVTVYEFVIREQSGIEQTGLAPRFRENVDV